MLLAMRGFPYHTRYTQRALSIRIQTENETMMQSGPISTQTPNMLSGTTESPFYSNLRLLLLRLQCAT